jgi:hypothetical protein
MDKYISKFNIDNDNNNYELFAISCHTGSLRNGHYTSYTKNSITNNWYFYDDEKIIYISTKLTENEFIYFFNNILSKKNLENLKNFIENKKKNNIYEYDDLELIEFLLFINCNNQNKIINFFKIAKLKKLENILITSNAYYLIYKLNNNFNQ